jgi:exosortase
MKDVMKGTGTKLTSTNRHSIAFATIALSGIAFWKPLSRLLDYALSHESSSHILLIPFISIYFFVWQRHTILKEIRWSAAGGIPTIAAGVAGLLLAQRFLSSSAGADYLFAATLSIVTIWCGEFLLFYGVRAASAAAFPLAFLALLVPMPESALAGTIHLLQDGSTAVTCLMFKIAGVSYIRQGFVLSLPTFSIEIAKECSGIRSSMALVITCLLAAKLFLRSRWKMTFVVLLAIPFAILKNGLRITTLTLLSIHVNPSFLTGKLHHQGGFVFFLITLSLMGAVVYFLRKSEEKVSASSRKNEI